MNEAIYRDIRQYVYEEQKRTCKGQHQNCTWAMAEALCLNRHMVNKGKTSVVRKTSYCSKGLEVNQSAFYMQL